MTEEMEDIIDHTRRRHHKAMTREKREAQIREDLEQIRGDGY